MALHAQFVACSGEETAASSAKSRSRSSPDLLASRLTTDGVDRSPGRPRPRWNIFPQIVAFVIFFTAIVAETNRAPFDLVEAEQEIVGGFHTEYSGMRFAMFFLAEYVNIFSMSAIGATLFLGGWNGPTFDDVLPGFVSAILPTVYFLVKTYVIVFLFFWIRATLPRLRYDQLMTLGWKRLIPGALGWLVLSTFVIAFRQFGLPWS
jgi:NADH-quinone oxidoreductase subunit H